MLVTKIVGLVMSKPLVDDSTLKTLVDFQGRRQKLVAEGAVWQQIEGRNGGSRLRALRGLRGNAGSDGGLLWLGSCLLYTSRCV